MSDPHLCAHKICSQSYQIVSPSRRAEENYIMSTLANGKRKYESIDLTGDDDAPSASQARRPPPGESVTQSQRDSWVDQVDEDAADDIIILSQDGDDTATATYQLYGGFAFHELVSHHAKTLII